MVDFEKTNNSRSLRFARQTKEMIDEVRNVTGQKVIFYSNRYIVQEWLYFYGQYWLRDDPDTYPLWIAQYPYYGWNDSLETITDLNQWQPALPAGVSSWKFWQYSADGNKKGPENGIERQPGTQTDPSVDLDVYNGTADEMHAWLGVGDETPDPVPVPADQVLIDNAHNQALTDAQAALEDMKR